MRSRSTIQKRRCQEPKRVVRPPSYNCAGFRLRRGLRRTSVPTRVLSCLVHAHEPRQAPEFGNAVNVIRNSKPEASGGVVSFKWTQGASTECASQRVGVPKGRGPQGL